MIIKEVKTYKFSELTEEGKRKALEGLYDINVEFDWWECDGLICDEDWEIFDGQRKVYFDIDRESFIQFPELSIKNKEKFFALLKIPKRLLNLVDIGFEQKHYGGGRGATIMVWDWTGKHEITPKYEKIMESAVESFNNLMEETLSNIRKNYEYLTSEQAIIETIEANDYDFTADGKIF